MNDAKLDLAYRDHCAHILINLNKCRREVSARPGMCHELHAYEACQYDEHLRRIALKQQGKTD